jgi:hypothetical protein
MTNYNPNKKDNIEELVNQDTGYIEGDYNQTNDSQIQTGPVNKPFNDNSDFKKGLPTTTNKLAQYANPRNWWTMYLKGFGGRFGAGGVNETNEKGGVDENVIRNMIQELLKQRNLPSDIVNNSSQIPSLDQINPEVANNVNNLITDLNSGELSNGDIDMIIKFIKQSIAK